MKYAVAAVADQTHAYWSGGKIEDRKDCGWTIKRTEARLFESKEEAEQFKGYISTHPTEKDLDGKIDPEGYWIEEVPDEHAFRTSGATW